MDSWWKCWESIFLYAMNFELIIVQVLGIVATLTGAILGVIIISKSIYLQTLKNTYLQLEQSRDNARQLNRSKNMIQSFETLADIDDLFDSIFENTNTDRILILLASSNVPPYYVISVIYSRHKSISSFAAKKSYRRLWADTFYSWMLDHIATNGMYEIKFSEMPDSFLKTAYFQENVTHSFVYFVQSLIDENSNQTLYCSFATHEERGFTDEDRNYIGVVFQSVRQLLRTGIKI